LRLLSCILNKIQSKKQLEYNSSSWKHCTCVPSARSANVFVALISCKTVDMIHVCNPELSIFEFIVKMLDPKISFP